MHNASLQHTTQPTEHDWSRQISAESAEWRRLLETQHWCITPDQPSLDPTSRTAASTMCLSCLATASMAGRSNLSSHSLFGCWRFCLGFWQCDMSLTMLPGQIWHFRTVICLTIALRPGIVKFVPLVALVCFATSQGLGSPGTMSKRLISQLPRILDPRYAARILSHGTCLWRRALVLR